MQKYRDEWCLPTWAALRQVIFSDPYRNLCIGVSKTHGEMHGFDFLAHLVALGLHFQAKLLQDGVEMAQHRAKLLQNCSP